MSTRIATAVLVFMFALNGFSWVMIESGTADFYGINGETGDVCNDDICIEDPDESTSREIDPGTSDGDTLFGQIVTAAQHVIGLFNGIIPALNMLQRLGMPPLLVAFLGSIMTVITTLAGLSFIRGFNL